jgi:outer membrane protein assembly factor BamB
MLFRCLSRLALSLTLLLAAGTVYSADWPQWRGPERNAISRETGLLKQWPAGGPKVLWQKKLGAAGSSFAVVGNRVYTMYQDQTKEYGVCLDAETGDKVWEYGMGAPYKNVATGPRATPTVDGDVVYFQDAQGNVACVKAADGKEVWKDNLITKLGAKYINWRVANSPFISGDLLVLNPGAKGASIVALNKKTGAIIWKTLDDVAGYSTPVEMKIGGVDSFVLLTGEAVVGVAAKDGAPLWRYPWPNKSKINVPATVVEGDKVFVTTGYGIGCVLLQIVPEGDKFTAKEVWPISKDMQCRYGNPIVIDGYAYGTNEKKLTCVDLKTGKATWTYGGSGKSAGKQDGFGYAAISYADGLFYVHGEKGNLALCKLTPEKCEIISEIPKILSGKEARWASPTIANGRLYVRDENEVVCYDIKAK